MRLSQVPGNKADHIAVGIKNEDTVVIPPGSPVVLNLNATDDGTAVVLPSTKADARAIQGLYYGVTTRNMNVNDVGDAVVFGFTPTLLLIRQTRASSTNNWLTEAARSVGEYLTIDTVNNAFITAASTFAIGVSASTATSAGSQIISSPIAVLGQTLASYASSASATSDTRTAITTIAKAFVRMM